MMDSREEVINLCRTNLQYALTGDTNLKLFKQEGKVIRVANVNGNERYDANTSDHVHLVFYKCGSVIDVMEADMNAAKAACHLEGERR